MQVLNQSYARESPGEEYWRRVMDGKPMPESIKGLFGGGDDDSISSQKFVKGFETKANAIIYHKNDDHAVENQNPL